jgi:hypothetical protein
LSWCCADFGSCTAWQSVQRGVSSRADLQRSVARGDPLKAWACSARARGRATDPRELESAEATSQSTLLAELGMAPDQPLVVAEGGAASRRPPAEFIGACLARRLDRGAAARLRAQEAALRQAVPSSCPRSRSGSIARATRSDPLPRRLRERDLPAFDRARGRVALAEATRARLGREFEARVFDARRELYALARALELDRGQLAEVERALPQLAQLEASERGAANRGDLDRVSYQAVRTSLFELRLLQEALAQAQLETEIGLELACGGPLAQVSEARP